MKISFVFLSLLFALIHGSTRASNPVPVNERVLVKIICLEKVPIVKASVNGKTAYFILDSGSQISLLNKSDRQDYLFTPGRKSRKEIMGFSGQGQILHEAKGVDLRLGGRSLHASFYCTDLSQVVETIQLTTKITINGIIGLDLMETYGFEIDFVNKLVAWDGD